MLQDFLDFYRVHYDRNNAHIRLAFNISEDQKDLITEAEAYTKVRDGLERFILSGGGVFFEARINDAKKIKILSQAVVDSIRKFMAPDDRYPPAFKTEDLPRLFRRLVNFFLPILAPEGQQVPPYGIEEGEERFDCPRNG